MTKCRHFWESDSQHRKLDDFSLSLLPYPKSIAHIVLMKKLKELFHTVYHSLKTVDYLILKEFIRAFIFIFALFLAIAFVLILFEELDSMVESGSSFGICFTYVMLRVPHEIIKATPMVVSISVAFSFGRMIRHNEILMLYIAGYRPVRIAKPIAIALVFLIIGFYWTNENISAPFAEKAHILMKTQIKGGTQGLSSASEIWLLGQNNRIYLANNYYPYNQSIQGLHIFEFKGLNNTISRRLFAKQAIYKDYWILHDVVDHIIFPDGSIRREIHAVMEYNFDRVPDDFAQVTIHPEQMSHHELKRIITDIRQAGYDPCFICLTSASRRHFLLLSFSLAC